MASFPPVDKELARPVEHYPRDPEVRREVRRNLQLLARTDGGPHYANSWGYTVFRTVYTPGSDDAFSRAIQRLEIYAKYYVFNDLGERKRIGIARAGQDPVDLVPNHDLWSRYYSEVIQDPDTLADATVEQVGVRFEAWAREKFSPTFTTLNGYPKPNARFSVCLMLDQESIDNILAITEDPSTRAVPDWDHLSRYVKAITTDKGPEGRRLWIRASVRYFVWNLWFSSQDPDFLPDACEGGTDEDGAIDFKGDY